MGTWLSRWVGQGVGHFPLIQKEHVPPTQVGPAGGLLDARRGLCPCPVRVGLAAPDLGAPQRGGLPAPVSLAVAQMMTPQ